MDRAELELIVGTYEDYVVGYQVEETVKVSNSNGIPKKKKRKSNGGDESISEKHTNKDRQTLINIGQSFAVRSHSGSVRCLAASPDGNLVFSAGYDEMMNLFNLRRRKLIHTMEGAVECATFVKNSHLVCGSDNGNIYIYECKSSGMILAKTLKGHKAAVTSISCHPSCKILLSISKDHAMRTWNLIKGRCAYVTQIKKDCQLVRWSHTGEEFMITANNEIYLYNSSGNLRESIKLERRVNSIEFITKTIFAVAIDSGRLEFFDLSKDPCPYILKLEAHSTRIKSIKCLTGLQDKNPDSNGYDESSGPVSNDRSDVRFATAASDGSVKIWSLTKYRDILKDPKELTMLDVGARITCMIASTRALS